MNRKQLCVLATCALLLATVMNSQAAVTPQTTTFTYQGQLNAGGTLPSGQTYYFTFTLYDALTGGNVVGTPINQSLLIGSGGLFTTDLDFGQIFNGQQYWLEIQVGASAGNKQVLSARQLITAVPVAQYALNSPAGKVGSLIQFSTGNILNGASVVSSTPILMGFGNSKVETIDGSGESTMPPEAGGFSFPIPFAGTIRNLQISADLIPASVTSINTVGLEYEFTVFRATSTPNNGIDHLSSAYLSTPLTSSLRFGSPYTLVQPGMFRTATNMNLGGSLAVAAGDRIGIRVRTNSLTDPSAADVSQLSFSATISYTPSPP